MEMMQSHNQQESILVGCVLPTCNDLIVLQQPSNVSPGGGREQI